MVSRWPTLVIPICLRSSCWRATRASPTISFSRAVVSAHDVSGRKRREPRWPQTYESICILLESNTGDKIGAIVCRPLRDDSLGQSICAMAIAISGRRMLGRRRSRVDGRGLKIGIIDVRRGFGDVALVLVVGVRLGVGSAGIKVHSCGVWSGSPRGQSCSERQRVSGPNLGVA